MKEINNKIIEVKGYSLARAKKSKINIKDEHQVVLSALEKANRKLDRPCLLKEVVSELSYAKKAYLTETYSKKLTLAVNSILILLAARNLITVINAENNRRFFGSTRVLENFQVPEISSRRRIVYDLVKEAVKHNKRAVRIEEVIEFAESSQQALDIIPNKKITHDIIGLTQTGELKRIEVEVYGFRGNTFYLPSDLPETQYLPNDTSNWLEKTYKCFQIVWEDKTKKAEILNQKLSPITTSEVREEFYKQYPNAIGEVSTKRFINMLLYLSTGNFPKLRKIQNPNYNSSAWLPIDVSDEEIVAPKHFYASDAERVEEAIRRIEKELKRPANIQDVEEEIDKDEWLKLKSNFSIAKMLNNAAKPMTINKFSSKVQRKVKYVGSVNGRMYYTSGETKLEFAQTVVEFWKLESQFEKLNHIEELKSINAASLPLLKYGRLHLLSVEVENIKFELENLAFATQVSKLFPTYARLKTTIDSVIKQIEIYKKNHEFKLSEKYDLNELLKKVVSTKGDGLLPSEAMEIVYPFYRTARKLKKDNQLVTLFHDSISRFPNPHFKNRFSKEPKEAAEYLFDRTELLIHTASKWGNRFARLQALIAKQELGALRNPEYLFPLLKDKDFTVRLKAVSCLAFMLGEKIEHLLQTLHKNDAEPNIRRLAVWALTLYLCKPKQLKSVLSS